MNDKLAPETAGNKRYVLSVLVEDKSSALTRVSGLFARRAFNIHSLAVGPSEKPGVSRITIVTDETGVNIDQMVNQLRKLIYVLKVEVLSRENAVVMGVCLIKIGVPSSETDSREKILEIASSLHVKVLEEGSENITIEVSGMRPEINAVLERLHEYKILEVVRSGTVALSKGSRTIYDSHFPGENL